MTHVRTQRRSRCSPSRRTRRGTTRMAHGRTAAPPALRLRLRLRQMLLVGALGCPGADAVRRVLLAGEIGGRGRRRCEMRCQEGLPCCSGVGSCHTVRDAQLVVQSEMVTGPGRPRPYKADSGTVASTTTDTQIF